MQLTEAQKLADAILVDHSGTHLFDITIFNEKMQGRKLINDFGRVELSRMFRVPTLNRLTRLIAISYE
jgi:hypothetical protein